MRRKRSGVIQKSGVAKGTQLESSMRLDWTLSSSMITSFLAC